MIAVEIPAELAEHPEVVPVDLTRECITCKGRDTWPHRMCRCRDTDTPGRIKITPDRLVGQRVALAWGETCPTCDGTGCGNEVDGVMVRCGRYGPCEDPCPVACPDCGGAAERMVVGWTAEVEAVMRVLTVNEDPSPGVDKWVPHVAPTWADTEHVYLWRVGTHTTTGDRYWSVGDRTPLGRCDDPAWSPGRYALLLRDVQTFGDIVHGEFVSPMRGRPFDGFAELGKVLA